jgi:hypothetical protein
MQRLPESIFDAKRLSAPHAVLRVVPYREPVAELPADPGAFVGRATSPAGMVLKPVLLVAVSVAFVWLVTFNAWDEDGFFPWFWNPIWVIFPWVFLTPLWIGFFRSLGRKPANDRFRRSYAGWRAAVRPTAGTVTDARIARTEDGGTADFVAAIASAAGDVVVGRLAPGSGFAPHEAPRPGDTVQVWRLPGDWVLVQASRDAGRGAASAATSAAGETPTLVTQLEQLAGLHRRGELSDEEFEQAKRRLLDA